MDSGTSCVCDSTDQSSDPAEYLESLKRKYLDRTAKLQVQQMELEQRIRHMEKFLGADKQQDEDESISTCSCDLQTVPKIFPETPVRDNARQIIDPIIAQPPTQQCSFFQKIMDNARSILSIKCQCASPFVSAKSTSITPKEVTISDFTPSDIPTRENDTPDTGNLPEGEMTSGVTDTDSKTSTCTCKNSNSTLLEASCSCNLNEKVAQSQQVSINTTSNPTASKTQDSSTGNKNVPAFSDDSENKGCFAILNGSCSCEACRCSSSMVDDKRVQLEPDQSVVIPKITLFSSKVDDLNAEVQATARVESRGLNTQFARNVSSKCVTCCQLASCPSKRSAKDAGDNTNAELPDVSITKNKIVNCATQKNTLGVTVCCQSRFCPNNTKSEYPAQHHRCQANAAAARGGGRPDGPPGCPDLCDKATAYKASGPDGPNFDSCFERCETTRQDGQNQCAFVGSPLLNPSDFRIGKPLEDKSAGTYVQYSEGPQKICQDSTFSLTSNDILEMQNIAELAKKERQMKSQIEALQKRERAYQEVSKNMNTLATKNAECCSCHTANHSSNIQNEIQKISQELRLENQILKSELMDLKIELKHCLEKVEGPMKQKLQTEKQKCEVLQQKLQHASQDMLLNQDSYSREKNQLQLQLCCACANITELNQMNGRLTEEMSQLDCLCAKLEDDLVKQKINEADTIKRLTNRRLSGDGQHNNMQFIADNRCDSSLDVIARKLSKTLKELAPCDECAKVPPEVAGAAKCIKELTDMVRKRRMKSSASSGCCCESKSKYSAKDMLGDECCTCCSESVERVDKKDAIKTRTKKASPPLAGSCSSAERAAPKSSAREISDGEKCHCPCPSRTAKDSGGEPNDATSHQPDQKTLQTLLPIPESFVQKDASSKFDVNVGAASFYSAQGERVKEKVSSFSKGTVTIRENARIRELPDTGKFAQEENLDDFVLATADVEQPTLDSKGTSMKEVKLAKSDVTTGTPPIKVDKACKAPCSGTKAGKDTEGEAELGVGVGDQSVTGATEEVSEEPISENVPDMSEVSGEAGSNRAGDGIDLGSEMGRGLTEEGAEGASQSVPDISEDATGRAGEIPSDGHMEESENDTLADNLAVENTDKTEDADETGEDKVADGLEPSTEKPPTDEPPTEEPPTKEPPTKEPPTEEPPPDGRIAEQEIPFEEIRIGTFPVDIETKAYAMDESPDGLHVTTTITGSGNLEIITEGPAGTIETTLTYTNEGNIEVVTEMVEYSDEKSSPAEQALEKYTTEPISRGQGVPEVASRGPGVPDVASRGPGVPDIASRGPGVPEIASRGPGVPEVASRGPGVPVVAYNLLEEVIDQIDDQAIMAQPKLKPLFPVASSKFSGPSGPETETPYTPSSVSGEGELTSNLGSQSSGVRGFVNVTPDLTSGGTSVMRDSKGNLNLIQDGDIITPEGFVLTSHDTPAEGPIDVVLTGTESASRVVQSMGGTQSSPEAIRQDVEGHTDPVSSEAGVTSTGADMPSGEIFTPDQAGSDADEGSPQSDEAQSKPVARGIDFDSADVDKSGDVVVPSYEESVAEADRTLDGESSPGTSPTGTRKTRDCSCQSKDQKDQSCQCCECKTIGVTTSGDKETITVEQEEMCKTPQEEPRTDTDSEFITTSDFTDNAAEQPAGDKISENLSKDPELVKDDQLLPGSALMDKTSKPTTSILIDQNMLEEHPELAGKSPSQQQQILESLGYVTPETPSILIDQTMLEEHPELSDKSPSEQEKILESLGNEVIPTTTSILVDQNMIEKHPELAGKSSSEQQQILKALGYEIPTTTSILVDQNMIEKHPELAGKSSSEQQKILESLGYVAPKTTSTLIDQNMLEKHPELAGKSSSEQQKILESLGYVAPKTTSTLIDQNKLEKHPELAGKSSSEQQKILESLGYVAPKTTSTLIDQNMLEKHPELAGKSSSEQQKILESLGYVAPRTTSTLIDQNMLEKHPELAGKSSSEQQKILESLGYVAPKTTSTLIDQNMLEKHPELAGKSSSEQQEILKSLGYVIPKTTSILVDQNMLEKHPELAGKSSSEQQKILESLGYVVPKTTSIPIDQNMLEKHPELVGKRPSQQQEILKSLGYVTPKISTLIDESVLEKDPELASKTPSQQQLIFEQQILENLDYATSKTPIIVNQELLEKHPELVGKTFEQQQIILAGLGYQSSSPVIDKPQLSPQEASALCKAPCKTRARTRDDSAKKSERKEEETLADASDKPSSKIIDPDMVAKDSGLIHKPSSKEISITCRAPCRSAATIHDNVAKFSGNKITRGDLARADSRSISLQKTPSSRDGSSSYKANSKSVSVQRDDEVVQAARNNSSTLTSSSTSNEKIKRKEKIKSKPGEVPSIVSELSDKDRPVIESPKKTRAQRRKRSSRIMDCLKCNCEDPCRCEVCSPDKSGRRQGKVNRPVRSCDCPSPVLMQPMPMASSMPLPGHAGPSTYNPFTCYPPLTPGTMVEGESPTSDDNDVKKLKRHSSKCECVDCLCMPKIKMLAETREYPVVYDRKQVYHVKTSCDTCSDAQKAKKSAEQRSRIPISTTTPNPPKPGITKQGKGLPGDDDAVSHSDSIYNSIACDCTDCKCVECPDPKAKPSKDVNEKPGAQASEDPDKNCDGKSDKDCCCKETCTCVSCTVEELLKKLQEAEKKLAEAQAAAPSGPLPDASPPVKSPDAPSDQGTDHVGENCTCPECTTCPRSDLMEKSSEKEPAQSPVANKPSEAGDEEECTCPECVCPGADSAEFQKKPESTPPAPSEENKPLSDSGHPNDCNCVDCTCPGIDEFRKTGSGADKTPDNVQSPEEKAGGGDDECDCKICECPGKTSLPPGNTEPASDIHMGDQAIPECDCKNCVCSPCADPKRADPKQNLLAECDCVDCKCSPCADPKRGKGKKTPTGDAVENPSHPSDCDCDECQCLVGIIDEKDDIHHPDCDCPECHCPGLTDQAVDKGGMHPSDCDCPECHCPGLTDQAVDKGGKHPSDCDCPECHCPGLTDQAVDKGGVHPLDIVDQAVHALGCACADCLCVECTMEAAHAPACRCDVCICEACDYPINKNAATARTIDDHPAGCSCIKCVCDVCEQSKHSGQPAEAGPREHGDGCKCVDCICKECLLKLEPLKHEEGCKCAQCTCVECLRTMSMGGKLEAKGLSNDECKSEKGDNCTCENCICIDCCGKGTADVVVGGQAGCTCTICQCDPCPEKESDQPCTCSECTCVECTKKKGTMVRETGDKQTHPPGCDCSVCQCLDSAEPKKQVTVGGPDDKETHSPVCDCPVCQCPDSPEKTKQVTTSGLDDKETHSPVCDCPLCQCPDSPEEPKKQDTARGLDDKETHSPVCDCPECKCPDPETTAPTDTKQGTGDGCDCVPVCTCEEPASVPDNVKKGVESDECAEPASVVKKGVESNECDCTPRCTCEEPASVPDNVKKDVESNECDCTVCTCGEPETADKSAKEAIGLPEEKVEAKKPAGDTGATMNLTDPPPFEPLQRIDCNCNNCDCVICMSIKGGPVKLGVGDDDREAPPFEIPVRIDCNCARCDCIFCNKEGPPTKEVAAQPSGVGPRTLVDSSAQPSKAAAGPKISAIKSKQSRPHHEGCTCPDCQCVICSPVIPTKVSQKPPGSTNYNEALQADAPIHCNCPTCTCNEGEIKTTTFESAAPSTAAASSGIKGTRSVGNNNVTSIDTLELPKPNLNAHMVQVHPVACDCQQCRCDPCADQSKKNANNASKIGTRSDGVPKGESVKQMDNLALAKSIQAANKENCECKSQIEEIKRTLERIRCACSEAEFRSTQNVGQTMGRTMDDPHDKPFVKQASPFGQTMSGLKVALANLQAKCKAKDRMIAAMTGELENRGDVAVFDKVLDMSSKPTNALDYDQSDDVKSMNRSQPATNVLYGRCTADQGTEPDCMKNVASKGVEVRSRSRKKRKEKDAKNIADDDCSCSKPQIVQKEEKDCQKLDLTGFEVIDIRRITDDSLIVKWNPPNCKLVSGYDIFVNGTLASKVMSGSRTSAMMHSLDLSKSVQITIYAVSKCGRMEPPAIAIYEIKS